MRCACVQVTQKVPQLANGFLQGIPETVDIKGLELNISLAGDPKVASLAYGSCFAVPSRASLPSSGLLLLHLLHVNIAICFLTGDTRGADSL